MPSFVSKVLREQLRLLKPIVSKTTIQDARFVQNKYGELGAKAASSKVDILPEPFDLFQAAWAVPKEPVRDDRVILYLHGGGYTAGHIEYALGFGSILAAHTGLRVLCVAYRLAPEFVFPAALDDAETAYRRLLETYRPENIFFAGESAGGGLLYCLCLRLKADSMPLPRKLIALSPWTDLAMTGDSYTSNLEIDPSLVKESLAFYAQLYAKDNLTDPFVSPLYGDLRGLPPSLLIAGTDELLRDDSVRMHEKLLRAGCQSTLEVVEGMWHVFVVFSIPEAQESIEQICHFIEDEPL